MTAAKPESESPGKWTRRRTPLFFGAFVIVFLVVLAGLSMNATERERGHEFIAALREERFVDAFKMCSSELQQHLVDAEGLQKQTKPESLPESFWWTETRTRGSDSFLRSSVRTWWSHSAISLTLHLEGDQWQIIRMSAGSGKDRMVLAVPRNPR